jgi:hypothetical protein
MIMGSTFTLMVKDLYSRKVDYGNQVLVVFCDDIALKYYRNYFRGNKKIILKSFDEILRNGLYGLRYREFYVLNFITSIEEIKDKIEAFISDFERGENNE